MSTQRGRRFTFMDLLLLAVGLALIGGGLLALARGVTLAAC
jgi:hypothetical protein